LGLTYPEAYNQSAFAQYAAPISIDDIRTRIDEIEKEKVNLARDVNVTLHDLDKVDTEITNITAKIDKLDRKAYRDKLETTVAYMRQQIDKIKSLDCSKQFSDLANIYMQYIQSLSDLMKTFPNESYAKFYLAGNVGDVNGCVAFQTAIGKSAVENNLNDMVQHTKQSLDADQKRADEFNAAATQLLNALKKRRATLQSAVNSRSPQQQIADNLWVIMLVISGASVATILGIKLFDVELQMEWVASGQVIQFVTVMILLCVITALGLSNILKQETLGTLLGGVAGYVLAQGVGRSAARNATRPPRQPPRRRPPPTPLSTS